MTLQHCSDRIFKQYFRIARSSFTTLVNIARHYLPEPDFFKARYNPICVQQIVAIYLRSVLSYSLII